MRNFHLPLPENLYSSLRAEAKRSRRPATEVARQAIARWIEAVRRSALERELEDYVAACAGSDQDLDPLWEKAAMKELRRLRDEE